MEKPKDARGILPLLYSGSMTEVDTATVVRSHTLPISFS